MTQPIKISIITACYNSEKTIGEAIASLKRQSWPNVEHVVVDGLSSDATVDIARQTLDEADVLISEKDKGIYDALNKGIKHATGDVVGFLHSDDLYAHDNVLSHVAESFADPGKGAVYGDLEYVSAIDTTKIVRYWKSGSFNQKKLKRGWMPPHPTFFMRRDLYNELGGFDLEFRISGDYDALLRYLSNGKVSVSYLSEVLVKMRVGGVSNRSLSSIMKKTREDIDAMARNDINPWFALGYKNLSKIPQFFRRHR
ncbi:glycosyltransferase [Halomonas sp. EGI 63088]|uniref:Glycosyltransferase n=1 Tax=Halomonas flagellata TaxID=2920385 RepID=A0ABS9S018_9GAMM|nr:glycosyltransferase family 2 protein [Halomonas flagellata]MCH4565430.1 glycosyltransferase [Halomonas flagellata]